MPPGSLKRAHILSPYVAFHQGLHCCQDKSKTCGNDQKMPTIPVYTHESGDSEN